MTKWQKLWLMLGMILVVVFMGTAAAFAASDYSTGVTASGSSTAQIWFKPSGWTADYVIAHFTIAGGVQQNVSMTYSSSAARWETSVSGLSVGDPITYSYTYNQDGLQYDTASSVYTVGASNLEGVTFYEHAEYGGEAVTLDVGSYILTQLNAAGIPNDWMSSLKVPSGYVVDVYQNDAFLGTKWTFTSDTSYVGSSCNDQMSSVKISRSSGSQSVYSVVPSSIPSPEGNGVMTCRIMNGTNGAFRDDQIYWAVLAINPDTGAWCYLDLAGQLIPISIALNDAAGHLTKDGVNYADIYHTISEKEWISLPRMVSGRMYLSVGGPCYIKTYDTGFAGPNIDNPTDPNRDIYFDFIEFTINESGYHGNTTRVDGFGFPIQHRLVNRAGNYDRTVGEFESETRAGLFAAYQNEVPEPFKDLGTLQAPYRVVAPIHGSFAAGGANANYFAGYSGYSTQDILLGTNGLQQEPDICAAINRHVYTLSDWNTVEDYYLAAPANYYAKFWHTHSIDALAYGFCYDDVNGQAAYLEVSDPKGLIVRVGW